MLASLKTEKAKRWFVTLVIALMVAGPTIGAPAISYANCESTGSANCGG